MAAQNSGMVQVQYVGSSDVRELTAAHWKALEVDDVGVTRWREDTNWITEVPKAAAEKLLESAPEEFQIVE